jgi:antitoxin FitA
MATIQVRELPEESYEVLRRRARAAGQSLQAHLRAQLIDLATRQTKEEAVQQVESVLARTGGGDVAVDSIRDDIHAERR